VDMVLKWEAIEIMLGLHAKSLQKGGKYIHSILLY